MIRICFVIVFLFCVVCFDDFCVFFFFFNDTATTEIYTLSLHDALPISCRLPCWASRCACSTSGPARDRKSTRLNSSHLVISYAVFCLKKKKKKHLKFFNNKSNINNPVLSAEHIF